MDPKALLAETELAQTRAANPNASAWVSANAGAGKTHVLKMRVERLLLAGTAPERILCLTYTKAAAAEMASRVFQDLATWATAPPATLAAWLHKLMGRAASPEETVLARQLFTRVIETPGGLRIETIHAFAQRLLKRFPLESGVTPGFTILDEAAGAALRREAIETVLEQANADVDGGLNAALKTVVTYAQGDEFDTLLARTIAEHDWLDQLSRLSLRGDGVDAGLLYRRVLGLAPEAELTSIADLLGDVLSARDMIDLIAHLGSGGKTDNDRCAALKLARSAQGAEAKVRALEQAFLTKSMEPLKSLMTKALRLGRPDLEATFEDAQQAFVELRTQRQKLVLLEATLALATLGDATLQAVRDLKHEQSALDFDDLIRSVDALLANPAVGPWVHFKLDGGLDHILVDEAQDTSPRQWSIIQALADVFFELDQPRDIQRTLFAVGDEKQSIYSFQGAEPRMFAAQGDAFGSRARAAGYTFERVPLNLSFRSAPPVLATVDAVFADPTRTPGVSVSAATIQHLALRQGHGGLVELWTPERPAESPQLAPWSPLGEVAESSAVERLAQRIATTIKGWLDQGECLASTGEPIRAGDILILLRRRRPFAGPMIKALKARGVPVAGADRMELPAQTAVDDLLTLGEVLLLPQDDLALAVVLKSPLFGFTDEDLIELAPGRPGTLWQALGAAGEAQARFQVAAETLLRWRSQALSLPAFEFLSGVLDRDGGRKALLSRLGAEAADGIDELVSLALSNDEEAAPSLLQFLVRMRASRHELKRDMELGRDEVRILTVHGAKGLEAPIVFLPDTCGNSSGRSGGTLLTLETDQAPVGFTAKVWPVKGAGDLELVREARAHITQSETQERNRLLYVALTRARDRLYVGGFEGTKPRSPGCWYSLIEVGLEALGAPTVEEGGLTLKRLATTRTAPLEAKRGEVEAMVIARPLPAFATRPAPSEPTLDVPLSPSKVASKGAGSKAQPAPSAASPLYAAEENRLARGTLTHMLLQHIPSLPPKTWVAAIDQVLRVRGQGLPPRACEAIAEETLVLLRHPEFAPVFGPGSQPEVRIAAEIARPGGHGPPLKILGEIDRLVERDGRVLILDFKTNRPPPEQAADVARVYILQLAAYRLAVRQIYQAREVDAALLWTDGPRLMMIPKPMLDAAEAELWQVTPHDANAA